MEGDIGADLRHKNKSATKNAREKKNPWWKGRGFPEAQAREKGGRNLICKVGHLKHLIRELAK